MRITSNRQLTFLTVPAKKLPPPIERRVHIAIANLLRAAITPGWVWFHVPNGELRSKQTGALLQRMGVLPGVSDFILVSPPNGLFHALELKRKGEEPSDEQYQFLWDIDVCGGVWGWADSYDSAKQLLHFWGAIKRIRE